MKIRTRFLAVLAAITLLPLIAAGLLLYRTSVARLHEQADQNLTTIARRMASEVDAFVYHSRESVLSDALSPVITGFLASSSVTQVERRVQLAQMLREAVIPDPVNVSSCAIFDRAGLKLVETAPAVMELDESHEAWILAPLRDGLPAVVPRPAGPGGAALWISAPVRNTTGTITGVLRLRYELAALQQIVTHLSADTGASNFAVILDNEGRLLAQDASLPAFEMSRLPPTVATAGPESSARPASRLGWMREEPGVPPDRVAFVPLMHVPWQVAVLQSRAAYEANATELRRSLLTLGSLIVALSVVFSLVAANSLTRPFARLAAAAERLGTGQFSAPVPEDGPAEVQTLARTFNRMAGQLQGILADLEQRMATAKSSEEQLRDLVDFSPVGIVMSDETMSNFIINQKFTEMFGYAPEEIRTIGDWWPLAYPDPAYRQQVQQTWQERLDEAQATGKDMRPMQAVVRTKDGRQRRIEFHHKQVGTHRITLFADLTDSDRTEQALRESEERFRLLVENSSELIALLDPEGRFLYASPNHRTLLGYAPEELLNTRVFDYMQAEGLSPDWLVAKFAQGGGQSPEFRFRRRDGEWRWFESSGRIFHTPNGQARAVIISRDVTSQRENLTRRAASEQRFATIFNFSPIGLTITNSDDGTILDANETACRLIALPREKVLGLTSRQFTNWPAGAREDLIARVKATGFGTEEITLKRPDGPGPVVQLHLTSIELQGRTCLLTALIDVTAAKVLERVHQFLLGGAGDHKFFEQMAEQAATLLGASRVYVSRIALGPPETHEPLVVWSRGQFVPSSARLPGPGPTDALMRSGEFAYWPDVGAQFPDRRVYYQEWGITSQAGIPLRTPAGRIVGTLGLLFDRPVADPGLVRSVLQIFAVRGAIELDRLAAEDTLRESEERFRLLVENSTELVAEITTSGQYLYASPNHEQVTGYTPSELVGRSAFDFIHPGDRQAVLTKMQLRETTGRYRYLRKDGLWRWFESSGRAFRTSTGEERGVIASRDVTDQLRSDEVRKTLETQLREAQKMEAIGTLAGGIAHDFNNILTGIMGNLQLIELDLPPGHNVGPLLGDAFKASLRARDLVAQILTFSRRQEHQRASVHLGPVVEEALRLLRATLPATIEIRADLDPDCPPVLCDSSQIHQVVMNLGTNAAHAIGEQRGVIQVSLQAVVHDHDTLVRHPQVQRAQTVRLSVADTGSGMDAPTLERIFEPFFTTKAPGAGTGLGLPVVHGIIHDHQGSILVESLPGEGTTFDLYLPPAERETTAAPFTPAVLFPGNGEQILVVDDEASVVKVATHLLQRLGYAPQSHTSPDEALAAFQASPGAFAAVLTDLTMPGLSGVELARQLRAIRPGLPVIIASGFLGTKAVEAAQKLGVVHFVRKPYSLQTLSMQLHQALAK